MATGRSTALYGQLQVFSLNTILSALNLQKVTGRLTLAQFDQIAEVIIKNGEVVDAWSQTERGLNALLPLFGWEDGVFSFNVQPAETQTINISLPVLQVRSAVYLEEQKSNKKHTPIFTREIPSANHIIQVNQDSDNEEVVIRPEQWSILRHLVTGPKTVQEMADLTETSLEAFVQVASDLVRNNMLRVGAPGSR
ncbi:MAG: DUF4388 domain-containing protein [Chloroflexota bacterium]|nr:DUF4388 domain-containing protein [Chloroflexota bacterium]